MTSLRRRGATIVGLAIAVAVVAWAIGVNGVQSALLASVVVTVGAGHTLLSLSTDVTVPGDLPATRHGTRREVARLSWTLTGLRGVVTQATAQRVRTLAAIRLARLGIDLHDPRHAAAAEELLGSGAYHVVIADPARPVRYPALVRCVAALERLDDLERDTPVGARPSTR